MNGLASLMAQGVSGTGPGLDIGELVSKSGNLSSITQQMTNSIAKAAGGTSLTPSQSPTSGENYVPDLTPSKSTPPSTSSTSSTSTPSISPPVTIATAPQVSPSATDAAFKQINQNFFNYANMYQSPTEVNNLPQNLMGYYADALLSGSSAAQPIYSADFQAGKLPGNRYFINTKTQCTDNYGALHERSILVDNVNEATMDSFPNNERGLMYSLFASMGNIDVGHSVPESAPSTTPSNKSAPSPSHSPAGVSLISDSHIPNCKLAKVKNSDQPTAKTIQGYLTDKDFSEVDSNILENFVTREGYATPLTDHFSGTISKTHGSIVTHGNNVKSQVNSAKSASQSSIASTKSKASSQIQSYGKMQSSDLGDVSSAKKSGDDSAANRIKPQYNKYYNVDNYPMEDLFLIFLNYNNVNAITPICVYSTLEKVKNIPPSISNHYRNNSNDQNCPVSEYEYQYPTLEPGQFINALKKYATYNYYYKDQDKFEAIPISSELSEGNLVNVTNEFVPPKKTCQLIKIQDIVPGFGMNNQNQYILDACMNIVNPNFNTFWNALEVYRDPIINAFMMTDYPQYFGYCPPSLAPPSQSTVPSNVGKYENFNETFRPMTYRQMVGKDNGAQLYFLLILFIVIVLCLFYLLR